MRRTKVVGLGLVLAGSVATGLTLWFGAAAARTTEQDVAQQIGDSLMRQKLQHAQQLLQALSIGDFMRMSSHSKELRRISIEARWSQPHSSEYAQYGEDFRYALERLEQAAENQNIDGAALNYVQMILTCVQCHKVVREGQEIAASFQGAEPGVFEREVLALLTPLETVEPAP